uniref:Uncharacterized protein n=1 Tax=Microviridae sp. cthcR2 TaxID=2826741 RepID=A0A8S5NQ31_9VIRU|nr:MAG TPA: hypothetical protein [Microviridae sp. cthcR2]
MNSSPRGFRALKRGLTFNYIINNLKFTIMKLLMTVQPKNGERPSTPVLIDANEISLCRLADDLLCSDDKVLIFQPVSEYNAAPCEDCDKKE